MGRGEVGEGKGWKGVHQPRFTTAFHDRIFSYDSEVFLFTTADIERYPPPPPRAVFCWRGLRASRVPLFDPSRLQPVALLVGDCCYRLGM